MDYCSIVGTVKILLPIGILVLGLASSVVVLVGLVEGSLRFSDKILSCLFVEELELLSRDGSIGLILIDGSVDIGLILLVSLLFDSAAVCAWHGITVKAEIEAIASAMMF
ncbi:hypothetical protein FDUTEX481_06981 [Tolypothrix sp. PCC 7601]|nr:hypothetical protein FDUTEX481_06981 [Tolypothrix sp. PCC 7601]